MTPTLWDPEWLRQKYIEEKLGTYQIGKLLGRDATQVHRWLKKFGIPIRTRSWENKPSGELPYQQKEWLQREYVERQRSCDDIASQFGLTPANIIYHLRRFGIPRRTISETRAVKHWGSPGESNPMFGKRGAEVPSWKGGVTPERQAYLSSLEWKAVAKFVVQRDANTCRRCGIPHQGGRAFHIHHIVPFAVRERRADPSNLVVLCHRCHMWVHSKKNVQREFRGEKGGDFNGAGVVNP